MTEPAKAGAVVRLNVTAMPTEVNWALSIDQYFLRPLAVRFVNKDCLKMITTATQITLFLIDPDPIDNGNRENGCFLKR
jgi:hypothetical protein